MTPEELQQAITDNTTAIGKLNQALNFLVSEFIRPNAQQHLQSIERLDRIEGIFEAVAERQLANTQLIVANSEAIARYDERLEETRQLVAKNASDIAQMSTRHDQMFSRLDQRLEGINAQQASNGQQIAALVEASRSQLTAIIGNGRRIDRLEQQAS